MLFVFAGAVTVAVVIQCIVLVSFVAASAKAQKELVSIAREIHHRAVPLIDNSARVVEKIGPRMERAADNLAEISEIARAKAIELDSVTSEMVMRARQQGRRVDDMVTDTLSSVDNVRHHLHRAVLAPVQQANAIFAGVKAALGKFTSRIPGSPFSKVEREEMFGDGEEYHA